MPDFTGKVALVTGAGSGIGAATARLLAAHGAFVWFADLDPAAAERARAGIDNSAAIKLDVTSEARWSELAAEVGRLDVLVNAAGISRAGSAGQGVAVTQLTDWRRIFAVNVEGTLLGCQHAMRVMERAGGAIVNIASTAALAPSATLAAYGASKAAVLQLTKSVAAACALDGLPIRCNAVLPGMVETPMTNAMTAEYRQAWEAEIPAGRFASPLEIAEVIMFLASGAASYMNATGLLIDGGLINRPTVRNV